VRGALVCGKMGGNVLSREGWGKEEKGGGFQAGGQGKKAAQCYQRRGGENGLDVGQQLQGEKTEEEAGKLLSKGTSILEMTRPATA